MNDVKKRVYNLFDELKINYSVVDHEAIFSEKDSEGIE